MKKYEIENPKYDGITILNFSLNDIVNQDGSIDKDLERIEKLTSIYSNMKVGRGGSHIWIADKNTNDRIAIIFYS